WIQNQVAVIRTVRKFGGYFQLLDRQVAFAGPRVDQGEVGHSLTTHEQILCTGRKFDRAPTFAQCLFLSAQGSVDERHAGKYRPEVGPCTRLCLLLRPGGGKRGSGTGSVSSHASN